MMQEVGAGLSVAGPIAYARSPWHFLFGRISASLGNGKLSSGAKSLQILAGADCNNLYFPTISCLNGTSDLYFITMLECNNTDQC